MQLIVKVVFWICAPLAVVAWWNSDNFVPYPAIPVELTADPAQKKVKSARFKASFNAVDYAVVPKYDYEIYGMVVSFRYHDGDRMLHKMWNDHLNVADVCVVWGSNAVVVDLNAFDFYNGQFTCNFSTSDSVAWARFSPRNISNNHLLSDDPTLRKRITSLSVGDIIRVRGKLAWYGQVGRQDHQMRKTSTTREDVGNGACETIYVDDFEVIGSMPNQWRVVLKIALVGTLLSAVIWVWGVGTGRFGQRYG